MAEHSSIEWTDATWNPITGCSVVSPGCKNCYAMKLAGTRLRHNPSRAGLTTDSKAGPVWNGQVRLNEEWLTQPIRWRRPRRIFVCAHSDLFHEAVPDEWIDRVFAVMALAPHHTFQVLTKRAERMRQYLSRPGLRETIEDAAYETEAQFYPTPEEMTLPLPNVWLGVSVEDQKRADERIPDLLATPAAVRFISAEPLLGPVDLQNIDYGERETCSLGRRRFERDALTPWMTSIPASHGCKPSEKETAPQISRSGHTTIGWVIVGGESGPGARPMHLDWARSLRDQCAAAGVPFFFKQVGEWAWPTDDQHHADYVAACNGKGAWPHDTLMAADGTILPGDAMKIGSRACIRRIGKKAAGRLLDGVEHNDMPTLPFDATATGKTEVR